MLKMRIFLEKTEKSLQRPPFASGGWGAPLPDLRVFSLPTITTLLSLF